ncbi:MAG TPA: transglycosylase SLT domain-containing protein [Burkholderiales bacterium]|nr:transglycosylase SLT domain-containing protein [Burkholderiales bacterium]
MFKLIALVTIIAALAAPLAAYAGAQQYEPLAASVRAMLHGAISDEAPSYLAFDTPQQGQAWLAAMSKRLVKRMPDQQRRDAFLISVDYEAKRAGLDPQLVLAVIAVESNFRKYAVSSAGARGYMQVMPFWVNLIGTKSQDLFHMRTNLRYGCTILRHYLDVEHGSLFRALGRYNGSLGQAWYPERVLRAWQSHWEYTPPPPPEIYAVASQESPE